MLERVRTGLIWILAVGISLQAIYTAGFGMWEAGPHRGIVFWASIVVVLLGFPLTKAQPAESRIKKGIATFLNLAMIVIFSWAIWEFLALYEEFENMLVSFTLTQQLVALGGSCIVLEATRRVFGLALSLLGAFMLFFCIFGFYFPGFLQHSGFSLDQTMQMVWYGFQGVFGLAIGVVLQLIIIFIVFGVILEGTGASTALIKIALTFTGRLRGGPALAAVAASALFGAMSGSVTANVVGTGAFTIPMIKKRGFSPSFSGAVEAAASTGGQIVPPVMGAAAFLMSDLTGIPYLSICIAALIPALFYYGCLTVAIILEAGRSGVQPVPKNDLPVLHGDDWLKSLMFIGPIATVIAVLVAGRSPAMAGVLATLAAIVLAFINPDIRKNPAALLKTLNRAGRSAATIVVAVGTIGVILAAVNLTGIGLRFASIVASFGSGNLFLSLLITAGACLILGMGMPTLPAYLIIVLVLGPVIKTLGVDLLAVHLFVFYFGTLSAITPPVALAAFAAAPIAFANPMKIAVQAMGLAFVGFIIPFIFVYQPTLLLVRGFEWSAFLWAVFRLSLIVWLFATAFIGYDRKLLALHWRGLRFICGGLLITNYPVIQIIGLTAGLGSLILWRVLGVFAKSDPDEISVRELTAETAQSRIKD